jgi:ribosomal protein L12E/L44/L45/RPP1/RPP2
MHSVNSTQRGVRLAQLLGAAALLAGLCAPASAQQRVAVGTIDGKGAQLVRAATVRALGDQSDVDVVGAKEVQRTSSRLGVDVAGGRADISAALGIAAWIEGSVEQEGRRVAITMNVVAGSGETLGVMSYSAKNPKLLAKRIENNLWKDLGDLIMAAQAPAGAAPAPEPMAPAPEPEPQPEAQPAPAEEEEEDEAEEEDEDDTAQESDADDGERPSPLDVGLSFAGFTRSFEYNDDLSSLRSYDLGLGPTVMLKLRWYPGAHFADGVSANIGLELRGQFAFAIDSALDDMTFPTSSQGFGVGLRARLPIDDHELAAVFGYAAQSYSIDAVEEMGIEVDPGVPSISYGYLRIGAELRFAIGESFAIGAAAAFLPVLSTGDIGEDPWFPRASASGMEGELNVSHALTPALELNAAFGLQRFAFSFNPELEDAMVTADRPAPRRIAGGASDQYLWATLGVRWLLGK